MPLAKSAVGTRFTILATILSLLALISLSGCFGKKVIKFTPLPAGREAGTDELIKSIRSYQQQITSLSCSNFDLVYTSAKKRDAGIFEKYPSFHGWILLKKPESVRFSLQKPVIKSKLVELLSVGDNFSLQYENKFYRGKNSIKELVVDKYSFPIRGNHIFEAIFPQGIQLDAPGIWISNEEQSDETARYYVLSMFKQDAPPIMHLMRRIWIERTGLTIARQEVFSEEGKVASDIRYSKRTMVDGFLLPLKIHIDRPIDGYVLDLEFKDWKVNPPEVKEDAFEMLPPPGANVIDIEDSADKEK
jgi:hypothetical protein